MPANAPVSKVAATKSYGAEVILYGDVMEDDVMKKLKKFKNLLELLLLHPFNDKDVIALSSKP